jgi:hypothetical protein
MSEPGFDDKSGYPPPGQDQGPPPYSQPGMGPVPPMQQQPMQQQPMQQQPMQQQMQQPGHMMHSSNTNTTVVIQQQQPAQVVIQGPRPWSTGVCSCFDDCGVCKFTIFYLCIKDRGKLSETGCDNLCTYYMYHILLILGLLGLCCPCILQCTVSSNAGECCCVAAMCPIALRTKIRMRHNIAVSDGSFLSSSSLVPLGGLKCKICLASQHQSAWV